MKIRKSIMTTSTYKVEMSQAEARLLRDLLSLTGGDPYTTRRDIADDMIEALNAVGLHWADGPTDTLGRITFK